MKRTVLRGGPVHILGGGIFLEISVYSIRLQEFSSLPKSLHGFCFKFRSVRVSYFRDLPSPSPLRMSNSLFVATVIATRVLQFNKQYTSTVSGGMNYSSLWNIVT